MNEIPTIGELKQLVAYMQSVVFPEYYPAMEAPRTLRLPEAFWAELPSISRLIQTDVDAVLHNDPAVTDRGEVILDLEREMLEAADNLEFERAAYLRDQIKKLKSRKG